jgi:hypothetical protein
MQAPTRSTQLWIGWYPGSGRSRRRGTRATCAYTSAATLADVGLSTALSWWWADPVAALVIARLAVKEGIEALYVDDD